MKIIAYIWLLFLPLQSEVSISTLPSEYEIKVMLKKVNNIRANGCFCDNEYMPPANTLVWSDVLYKSALGHAKEMSRYNYFAHYSIDGKDIGDRLERYGYNWQVAGENLGEETARLRDLRYTEIYTLAKISFDYLMFSAIPIIFRLP